MTTIFEKLNEKLPVIVKKYEDSGMDLRTETLDRILLNNEDIIFTQNKIYNNYSYEVILNTNYDLRYELKSHYKKRQQEQTDSGEFIDFYSRELPKKTGYIYELSPISDLFIAHTLNYILNSEDRDYLNNLSMMLHSVLWDADKGVSLEDEIMKIFKRNFLTLKIKSKEEKDYQCFKNLKNSYLFDFMCKYGIPLTTQSLEQGRLFSKQKRGIRGIRDDKSLEVTPNVIYEPNLIIHFKRAMTTDDISTKFLSLYHIIEYYFDTLYNKKIVNNVKNWLIDPKLSLDNDKTILNFVDKVKKLKGKSKEDGQGNETEAFKLVLEEYVDIDKLKEKLTNISKEQMKSVYQTEIEENNACDFYNNNSVSFLDKDYKINFSDEKNVKNKIQKRIYTIRNSIVHNKDSHTLNTYNPYDDEEELRKEIPLIEAVATEIIINTSTTIK